MTGQFRVTSRYSSLFVYFIILAEVVTCGGLFTLFTITQHAPLDDDFLKSLCLVCTIFFAIDVQGGVHLHMRRSSDYEGLTRVLSNIVYFSISSVFILHLGKFYVFSWPYYLLFLLCLLVLSSLFRIILRRFAKFYHQLPKNRRIVVMVGCNENSEDLYKELCEDKSRGFDVIGYFDDMNFHAFNGLKFLGNLDSVIPYLKKNGGVQEVYCSISSEFRKPIEEQIVSYCENNFIYFYYVPRLEKHLHQRMHLNVIGSTPYMNFFQDPLRNTSNRFVKRAFDIIFSLFILIFIFPWIYVIVGIITKITMPGPVFFKQKRNGINGKEFVMYKFRSMKVNKQADTQQASKEDPRITGWGKILRKTNLDEMPQFINVLKGDMSVVGPRPHMVKHTEEYSKLIEHYMLRHYIKPGVTGYSQVTGFRGETKELSQMEGRIKGDIWYLEHWSLWLDIYIVFKTILNAIIGDDNAY